MLFIRSSEEEVCARPLASIMRSSLEQEGEPSTTGKPDYISF